MKASKQKCVFLHLPNICPGYFQVGYILLLQMPIFSKLFFFHILCFLYVYQPFSIPIRFLPREWLVCEVLTWGGGRRIIIYWEILKEPKKEKVCQNRLVMNVRSMEPSRLCHICILYFCQNALPVLLNLLKDVWGRNEKVIDRTQTSNRMKLFESTWATNI